MRWLELRRKERRRWTGTAVVAAFGLMLGVVGVAPAFANLANATCVASVDQLSLIHI